MIYDETEKYYISRDTCERETEMHTCTYIYIHIYSLPSF